MFVFFPYALNLSTEDLSDHFSIELIDVSKRIFFSNVLINSEKFISNFYLWKKLLIDERKFERCIYLYSLFHENAHCLGPWKEMPSKDPRMKVKYNSWNIFSEMSADLFTILGLKDFPEVVILILITRIFWYGARDNTVFDSDTTLSVCLWNCLVESGGITLNSNKTFAINFNQSIQTIKSLLKEILDLGNTVITLEKDPDDHLEIWLQKNCGWNGISHSLPQSLKSFYC